jgi:hypothetical protein
VRLNAIMKTLISGTVLWSVAAAHGIVKSITVDGTQ